MFRKSLWILKGKPVQSVLHILLMIIIASTLLIGMIFKEMGEFISSGETFHYTITVAPKDPEESISPDTMEQIVGNKNIVGYNYNVTQEAQPGNFKNWVEFYACSDLVNNDLVELSINLCVESSDIFINNTAKLVMGSFPTKNKHGVIVEKCMANYNDMQLGDIIEIETTQNDSPVLIKLPVVGIYKLELPIEVEEVLGNETAHVISRCSRLYTNIDSIVATKYDVELKYVDLYTKSEDNASSLMNKLNIKLGETMIARDSTDTKFVVLNRAVDNMNQYYKWIVYGLIIMSLMVFILFSIYTQHRNIYEIAVLSVLGKSNKTIILQNLINVFFLYAITSAIFLVLGFALSKPVGLFWIYAATKDYMIEVSEFTFRTEQMELINNYSISNHVWCIIGTIFIVLLISVIITIIYCFSVLKLTTQKRIDRII